VLSNGLILETPCVERQLPDDGDALGGRRVLKVIFAGLILEPPHSHDWLFHSHGTFPLRMVGLIGQLNLVG
jgi:hypothetical protein